MPNGKSEGRARIFLSCGQRKDTDELTIALKIKEKLDKAGYETYVATQEQTLSGLRENIFNRLRNSEYFIFIDFKREKIGDTIFHRGSLFSHQELAVASFLDHSVLALQEDGVKPLDGMLGALQANAISFTDRNNLPNLIVTEITRRNEWDSCWRNEIVLERDASEDTDPYLQGHLSRFFHIEARNRHRTKIATNCYAYLEKLENLSENSILEIKTAELKWAGYTLPNAAIMPVSSRLFDAGCVLHSQPIIFHVNLLFADATDYQIKIQGKGDYKLQYVVISDNFPPARCTVTLHLDPLVDQVSVR